MFNYIGYTVANLDFDEGNFNDGKKRLVQLLMVLGLFSLNVASSMADIKSVETGKSLSQGFKENPIMAYVLAKHEDLRITKLHSVPETGELEVNYNNDEQTRTTLVSAQKLPANINREQGLKAFLEIVKLSFGDEKDTLIERQLETNAGHEVHCVGFINEGQQRSESLCVVVFDRYYIQASLPWALESEKRGDEDFSRSDDFVKTMVDNFARYEGI